MHLSGPVIKGRQYQEKVPTANILMEERVPHGVYVGESFNIDGRSLGKSFVFISDYAPDIAEVYITGYWKNDLYGKFISVENLEKLDRDDLRNIYDNAMTSWEEQNAPALP
jgi:FAD synthase